VKHLKIYHAIRLIRRQGSIRKAAETLAVSPSALNRSIQSFEDAIGVDVFERIPAGVRLTSAGELLLDVVERHLIEFEELQRQLGNLRDGHTGKLRVGISDDIAAGLPLLAIRDLETEMPGVSADIFCGDVMRLLRQREIDLAIVTNPETDRSVEVLASQNVRLAAFATPEWVGTGGGQVGLWDLSRGRLVLPPEGTGSRTAISHAFRRHALDEGTMTSVAAAQLGQAMTHGPRTCIFPRTVFEGPGAPAALDPIGLDIGSVQISVLRLSGVPLSRPAQCLLRSMESRLNAMT
jgi:DNA-binding transcriptional LysR family regulator